MGGLWIKRLRERMIHYLLGPESFKGFNLLGKFFWGRLLLPKKEEIKKKGSSMGTVCYTQLGFQPPLG